MWCGCGGTKRTWSRTPSSSISACSAATSPSPSWPLAPPTISSSASGRRSCGQRPHRDVGCLQRLDAADEQQHRRVDGQVERTAGATAFAGREERVLDAGRDDLDATLRVAVQAAELALLLGAADADGVGAGDDLVLGAVAPLGLVVAALGLHLGQRVERADERDVELVLDAVRDQAAEEVVGVHDVGRAIVLQVVDDRGRRTRRARVGSCSLARSNGPAVTCTTRWPGSTSTTSGWSALVRRV